jgi:hypothetical protein
MKTTIETTIMDDRSLNSLTTRNDIVSGAFLKIIFVIPNIYLCLSQTQYSFVQLNLVWYGDPRGPLEGGLPTAKNTINTKLYQTAKNVIPDPPFVRFDNSNSSVSSVDELNATIVRRTNPC